MRTPSHRGARPPAGRLRPTSALAALGLALILTSGWVGSPVALAAPELPEALAATGNAAKPEIEQIREYCARLSHASARNVMVIGGVALAAIVLVLFYTGNQRKAKARALADLHDCEAAWRLVANSAQDAVVAGNERGEITYWNPAAEALFGISRDQALGRPLPSLFADASGLAPDYRDLLLPDHQTEAKDPAKPGTLEAVHNQGHRIPVRTTFVPLRRDQPQRTVGLIRQGCSSIERAYQPEAANVIIENAAEGISITDAAGVILRVNPAYCQLTGYTPEEVIGKTSRILNSGRHDRTFFEAMWRALVNEGRWEGKIWNRRKDGSLFLEHLVVAALRDSTGTTTHYVGMVTDVTHKGLDPAQIGQLAFYDPLTGLATRALLIDHLREAVRRSERTGRHVALFYINLDNFSAIITEHGHAVGDALIKEYAERLESRVRRDDTVARPGGDEFALILRELASIPDVPPIADKLLARLAEPLQINGRSLSLKASMGIALYPDHGNELEVLVGLAKDAMTRAKAAGKDRWVMYQPQETAVPQAATPTNPPEPTAP